MFRVKSKGQSTLEYVILLGFIVAALIAMGIYMKRGISGRLRTSTDQVGAQYSAKNTTGLYTVVTSTQQTENMAGGGKTTTSIPVNLQRKTGSETIEKLGNEEN
jgi:uncharacterized protein (UPF0333 family)